MGISLSPSPAVQSASTAPLAGTVWVSGVPGWLWAAAYAWMAAAAALLKTMLHLRATQHLLDWYGHYAISYVLGLVMVGAIICGPTLVLAWGARTWLRRRYPDLAAMTWDQGGVHLRGSDTIGWANILSITKRYRARHHSLVIETQDHAGAERIEIPLGLVLDGKPTLTAMAAAHRQYRVSAKLNAFAEKAVIAAQIQRDLLIEAYGKTASQLRAEGGDVEALYWKSWEKSGPS